MRSHFHVTDGPARTFAKNTSACCLPLLLPRWTATRCGTTSCCCLPSHMPPPSMQVGSVDRPSGCSSATGVNVVSHTQSAAAVEVVLMARNHLQPQHVPALVEQLGKFPSLKRLDVSANPGLGCGGAAAFLSALSGMPPRRQPYLLSCEV